ncbi:hypothetical protein VP01_746g3 [Puccinia sorghi]|uniref:Tet-like 2OG-Fe(II) oxygenase domain-containing protein n=1 Tax=Puccinia sorghi TaxID=27349 RepID=A0A0L6UCF0_9BASI|nr:hypothetical protein VP01_746g3 [Puccinia sorghi]
MLPADKPLLNSNPPLNASAELTAGDNQQTSFSQVFLCLSFLLDEATGGEFVPGGQLPGGIVIATRPLSHLFPPTWHLRTKLRRSWRPSSKRRENWCTTTLSPPKNQHYPCPEEILTSTFCKLKFLPFSSMSPAELNGWERLVCYFLGRTQFVEPVKKNGPMGGVMWADGWRKSLTRGEWFGQYCSVAQLPRGQGHQHLDSRLLDPNIQSSHLN